MSKKLILSLFFILSLSSTGCGLIPGLGNNCESGHKCRDKDDDYGYPDDYGSREHGGIDDYDSHHGPKRQSDEDPSPGYHPDKSDHVDGECDTQHPCRGGKQCVVEPFVGGKCVDKPPKRHGDCDEDRQCPYGMQCVITDIKEGGRCLSKFETCSKTTPCTHGEECLTGFMYNDYRSKMNQFCDHRVKLAHKGESCNQDTPCESDLRCIVTSPGVGECRDTSKHCLDSSDCKGGSYFECRTNDQYMTGASELYQDNYCH